ncbi:hypothetical protein JK358_12410 [Nocardia sp. 2]|uniref:CdiI immunity protein domain-containing protein n=1 Tax=Nocardia acididurans TaxID=2802282 RepID=A0ABS1M562_9NOCA|nr:hypothetical protein [Nocardia acididurans]MBL1075195.1 hypothetical protein [Nocardia acididurans]
MEIPEPLRELLNRPSPPAIEQVRDFLGTWVADCDGLHEVREQMGSLQIRILRGYVEAIETLLATPQPPDTLRHLVTWDGNWVLDAPSSDEAAAAWLRELATLIRSVIDETA